MRDGGPNRTKESLIRDGGHREENETFHEGIRTR